jgi:WXG100 family type VII secretion target
MDFAYMDELSQAYGDAAQALESARTEMQSIVKLIEDGTLIGAAGEALSQSFQEMSGAMQRLGDKAAELKQDILEAKQYMERSDKDAGQFYQ